eukprot:2648874-Prymnesium_polylepis.1
MVAVAEQPRARLPSAYHALMEANKGAWLASSEARGALCMAPELPPLVGGMSCSMSPGGSTQTAPPSLLNHTRRRSQEINGNTAGGPTRSYSRRTNEELVASLLQACVVD